jgi:hypothetical protein
MPVEPSIRYLKQLAMNAALCDSAFVPGYKQDGLALWVEGKCDAPNASIGIETQLLHVGVARTLRRIDLRPPQERPFLAKDCRPRCQYVLN